MKFVDSEGSVNHFVPFSNGALRPPHVERIGPAFPLLLKLEDMVTAGDGTDGLVLNGRPVTDQYLAANLGKHRKTIAAWRRRLVRHNYLASKKTPVGNVLCVRKSKKWQYLQNTASGSVARKVGAKTLQGLDRKRQEGGIEIGRTLDRKREDKQYRTGRKEEAVAATVSECWKEIGQNLPLGVLGFRRIWEFFFASKNAEPLSEAMERAIQRAQLRRIPVPRPFYDAKRAIEAGERINRRPEEMAIRTLTPEEIPA